MAFYLFNKCRKVVVAGSLAFCLGSQAFAVVLPPIMENNSWINAQNEVLNPSFKVGDARLILHDRATQGFVAPIIENDLLIFLDAYGHLHALNLNSKQSDYSWSVPLYHVGYTSAGLSASQGLVFCTVDNLLYAVDINAGKVRWRKELRTIVTGEPVSFESKVVALTADNYLYVFNSSTGSLAWSYQGAAIEQKNLNSASPSFAKSEDILVVPFSNGDVAAFNSNDGKKLWDYRFTGEFLDYPFNDVDLSPKISTDYVVVSNKSHNVAKFELSSGKKLWHRNINIQNMSSIVNEHVFVVYDGNRVGALNVNTGVLDWSVDFASKSKDLLWSAPTLAADKLWILNSKGGLVELDPISGKLLSVRKVPGGSYRAPLFANSSMYFFNDKGLVIISK